MYVKIVIVFGFVVSVYDAFLFNEPCNRTIKSAEIDFVIGKGCKHGIIYIHPSASGSLSAYFFNKNPDKCINTVCLRSCNTISSSIFALPQDPFRCCHTFPRPTIDIRDSVNVKRDSSLRYKPVKYGDDWMCTRPHKQPQIVIDMNVKTSHCPLKVEYALHTACSTL